MGKEAAWTHYFTTGEQEPLVKAYWDSISYLSWALYPHQQEDMFQVGMMGLLKAIKSIDPKRVKSKDAWVWLNVKGMMRNVVIPAPSLSLNEYISDEENGREYIDQLEDRLDIVSRIDLIDAAKTDDPQAYLSNYRPKTVEVDTTVNRYERGEISLRALSRELGISRRQAYRMVGSLPESWRN